MVGLEKLAAGFQVATKGMDEDELFLLSAAAETVLLEKKAGVAIEKLSENEVLLISAAIVDNLLGR